MDIEQIGRLLLHPEIVDRFHEQLGAASTADREQVISKWREHAQEIEEGVDFGRRLYAMEMAGNIEATAEFLLREGHFPLSPRATKAMLMGHGALSEETCHKMAYGDPPHDDPYAEFRARFVAEGRLAAEEI